MSTTTYLIVTADTGVGRLAEAARELPARVVAIAVGDSGTAEAAAGHVDEVIWFDCPVEVAAEGFAGAVAEVVTEAPGVLVSDRDPASRVLLGAAAAALGAPVLVNVLALAEQAGATLVSYGAFGGIARRTVAFTDPVAVLMDGGDAEPTDRAAPISCRTAAPLRIEVTGTQVAAESAADLAGARRVLGVGRGLKARADLAMIAAAGEALDAEIGCTRPLAEGLDWLAKDRYIGVSGQHIAPELYLAAGVSGQLQHLAGVRDAGTIVAINSDPEAPIADHADYLVVGDLYRLLPAITAELG